MEKVPPTKRVTRSRRLTTWKLWRGVKVKRAKSVTILAKPSLAPGAKTKGDGNIRSKILMTTPWATRSER